MQKQERQTTLTCTVNPLNRTIITSAMDIAAWAVGRSFMVAEKILNSSPQVNAHRRVSSRKTR